MAECPLLLEDFVFGLLDDDVEPDAEVRGYDVHQSETSHNDVAVLDDLNLQYPKKVV
jgi:hypothetical protein